MNRDSRSWEHLLAGVAIGTLVLGSPALAADLTLKASAYKAVYNWTGFYLGGHVGYGGGSFGPGTNPLPEQGVFFPHSITGLIGGFEAGYNRQLANNMVLGVEADVLFTSPVDQARLMPAPFNTIFDYVATARGRAGYALGTWMPYITGGIAWSHTHVNLNDLGAIVPPKRGLAHAGWTAGIGLEHAVSGNWTVKAEYDYIDLARRTYDELPHQAKTICAMQLPTARPTVKLTSPAC
jgi:high affinity Mn2+ porin